MHRIKTQARSASEWSLQRTASGSVAKSGGLLPTFSRDSSNLNESAVTEESDRPTEGRISLSTSPIKELHDVDKLNTKSPSPISAPTVNSPQDGGSTEKALDEPPPSTLVAAPYPIKSEVASIGIPTVGSDDGTETPSKTPKPPMTTRMVEGSKRFVRHTKDALFRSWVNVLLLFVPVGIIVKPIGLSAGIVFGINAVAIIPLAGLLAHATEAVASRLGDTWGALLNISFGNAVELIIFIIALVKNEISIVQAALLGSILANLLLILGMAFLLGGLRYREQLYNNTVTQMSACLLSLSVVSLLLPTAFHASFKTVNAADANTQVLRVSRGTSVVLLLVYILYLGFQLKSHSYLYESTPQAIIDEESYPGVLADIMNSSSSSDTSSSDESYDTDESGSIYNTGKRIKRALRKRRRRKSVGSASSVRTGSAVASAISSTSSSNRRTGSWKNSLASAEVAQSSDPVNSTGLGGHDADAEHDHMPRIRDFVKQQTANGAQVVQRKQSKKQEKKSRKKRRYPKEKDADNEKRVDFSMPSPDLSGKAPIANLTQMPATNLTENSDSSRHGFNVRPFGRATALRPSMPKMLSQNVFVTPSLQPPLAVRPVPTRAHTSHNSVRRTTSMPERMNRDMTQSPSAAIYRTDPLPPFHHQAMRQQYNLDEAQATPESAQPEEQPTMSRTAAVVLLLITTGLVAVCAEFMVDAIPAMLASSTISQAFVGLIILPIVSNAAEHVTAVTVAAKNKMDLAIGVAVGSSIQIALFVTPLVVLLGWILDRDMSLYFNLFDTISLFVTAFVINFLILDGRSNYLEGSLLIAVYIIIALGAFFYPNSSEQSVFGGGETG